METVKKGSRGEAVKTLQRALNLLADGIYGPLTEEAVIAFQKAHGLKPDGVVGPNTWAKLCPAGTVAPVKRKITEIILHCTASKEGQHQTVEQIRAFHTKPVSKGGRGWSDIGYNFVVYLDGSVHAGRSLAISGAHCVGHNTNSIGITYVGGLDKNGKAKDTRTDAQKAAIRQLVDKLCQQYGITKNHIYGHCEFANKACPCFDVKKEFRV